MAITPQTVAQEYTPRLRETLKKSILDFWFPDSVDEMSGGFLTTYTPDRGFERTGTKLIVTQARMLWLAARLFREGYGDEYLEYAQQGYNFLTTQMRDTEHGGYYWETETDGTVLKANKHLYGQAFVLYALSEYFMATETQDVRKSASKLAAVLEKKAYDKEFGGYIEYFERDWTPITEGDTYLADIEPDWSSKKNLDARINPETKLMNTHLHLMEAFTAYYKATKESRARKRLSELVTINTNTVVRTDLGACTDKYSKKWQPLLDNEDYRIVSYGHDIENVWLSMEAVEALEKPVHYYQDLFETLWAYTRKYGYDEKNGGVYFYGPFDEEATNRLKAWWVQAEALVSSLKMYTLTEDEQYLTVFAETYEFLEKYQIDLAEGEWHSAVTEDLETRGSKAAIYKAGYHNGRALLNCLTMLEAWSDAT